MSAAIDINGKKLLPIVEAISVVDYSRDYVTRLARERKIVATQIGRKWYIDIDSLKNYQATSQAEQEIKKRRLSDQRKKDLAIKAMKAEKGQAARKRLKRKTPAMLVLTAVVLTGFGLGVWLEPQASEEFSDIGQLANVRTGLPETNTEHLVTVAKIKEQQNYSGSKEMVPNFSPNASQRILDAETGLLLLPHGASAGPDIDEYFSDPITTVVDADGNTSVVRTDESGEPMGEEIPFVIVPINSSSP